MREILFRGKTTRTKMWVFGHYSTNYGTGRPEIREKAECCFTEVIPETVGQYTGFTDKNGKKIFDGDLLVFCKGATHPIKVYWDGLGWKFLRNGKNIEDAFECNTIDHIRFCEIIGNIHDNPELLSKGA